MTRHLLVAFDIDGTLIDLTGAGSRAMNHAFRQVLGLGTPPQVSFAGSTDRAIVTQVFKTARRGARPSEADLERFFACYLDWLPREIASTPYSPTPAASELLSMLRGRPNVTLGLATGNIREAARLKLESSGLGWSFDFGAFGEETMDRETLVARALERGGALLPPDAAHRGVVIGDTPRDVDAAHANGALAIAVSTGPFSIDSLRVHSPAFAVESLAETLGDSFWCAVEEERQALR